MVDGSESEWWMGRRVSGGGMEEQEETVESCEKLESTRTHESMFNS